MNAIMFLCGALLFLWTIRALCRPSSASYSRFLRCLVAYSALGTIGGLGMIHAALPAKNATSDCPPITLAELRECEARMKGTR